MAEKIKSCQFSNIISSNNNNNNYYCNYKHDNNNNNNNNNNTEKHSMYDNLYSQQGASNKHRHLKLPNPHLKPSLLDCAYKDKYKQIFADHLLRFPWMIIKYIFGIIYSCLIFLFFLREPTDRDVIGYVEYSVLSLLVSKVDDEYHFEVDNCRLKTLGPPHELRSIHIIYRKDADGSPTITFFSFNGKETKNRQLMMAVVYFYHIVGGHTKCHLFSNTLTEYIVDNDVQMLYPSTKTSVPLHNSLLFSDFSPNPSRTSLNSLTYKVLAHVYSTSATRESQMAEAADVSSLKRHHKRPPHQDTLFLSYLRDGRDVVKKAADSNGLPHGLHEALFNHIVVHAVDHISTYNWSKFLRFGCGLRETSTSYEVFRSLMFRWQFSKPSLTPFHTNKIKYLTKNTFYQEIYHQMKDLDQKYGFDFADDITASVMY